MRIDRARCVHCELCYTVAPIIQNTPERIPITSETLEAMATCPVGALVWREDPAPISELPERNPT